MDILSILSNPFVWGFILFVLGFIIKAKLNSYLKLVNLLIDAIEIVDSEIKDILPPTTMEKLTKIKVMISNKVSGGEAKILDDALANKGYLMKGGK